MNKKEIAFWAFVALLVFYFFLAFGVFLFQRQEEGQFFIPAWWNISEHIGQAGGFCAVVGQWIIQYYRMPMLAISIHTFLLLVIGISTYKLLQGRGSAYYHLPIALFPMLILLKMSIRGSYLVDGTVALALMMLALLPLLRLRGKKQIAVYGVLATCVLFGLAGLLSVWFAVLYVLVAAWLCPRNEWRIQALWCLLPALLFALFSRQLGIPVPLSEGFRPEEFLEVQLQPHYYIYYVWALFVALLAGSLLLAFLLSRLNKPSRWMQIGITLICFLGAAGFGKYCMPDKWDIQNRMMDELAYLAHERQWNTIINRYKGREIQDYISLNYLNLALAQEGKLADALFTFDQRGAKSLVLPWNQSSLMTKMLCDIHFAIGDLGMAESYAMDAITQSKRGGSARMIQRLVQINLIRGEKVVAHKYLKLLEETPFYRDWAEQHYIYLENPDKMQENPELKGKFIPEERKDQLYSLMTTDSLWAVHPPKSIGWEYRGCYYLLDKKLEKFRSFARSSGVTDLPRHFQEAWLMLDKTPADSSYVPVIAPEIEERYRKFRQVLAIRSANDVNMQAVYREYGDTYWFYYYFKLFKEQQNSVQ